jgi:hypothetical protein
LDHELDFRFFACGPQWRGPDARLIHDCEGVFYGPQYDLSQRFCGPHFNGGDSPALQNANGQDTGGELPITDHVPILWLHYGAV